MAETVLTPVAASMVPSANSGINRGNPANYAAAQGDQVIYDLTGSVLPTPGWVLATTALYTANLALGAAIVGIVLTTVAAAGQNIDVWIPGGSGSIILTGAAGVTAGALYGVSQATAGKIAKLSTIGAAPLVVMGIGGTDAKSIVSPPSGYWAPGVNGPIS